VSGGFENPGFLGGLILLIPLGLFYLLSYHKSKRIFALIASSGGNGSLGVRYFLSRIYSLMFFASLLLALAGPHWGTRVVSEYRRGVDTVLALDLSRSMGVRDSPEGLSRLEQARRTAAALIRDLEQEAPGENRFALAMGKGRGILALPLSYDTEAVLALLETLEDGLVTGRGTNLESLVDTASGAFQDALPSRRLVILFSDGEDLSGSLSSALERAAGRDVPVSVLGLGTETGGPVPLTGSPSGSEGRQDVLVDERGLPVISFRRSALLRNAAEHTGGIYLDGNREDAALLLTEHIRSLFSETGAGAFRREPRPRWRLFVLAGAAALVLSSLAGLRRRSSGHPGGGPHG
jgi:Ca-activated chloride channel family protein